MLGLDEALLLLAQPVEEAGEDRMIDGTLLGHDLFSPCGQGVRFRLGALLGERDLASQLLLARAERFEVGGP